jgi:hypothetical protein
VPVAKYFVFVGSALAALLLMVSWYCPAPPAIFADRSQVITTAAIRIKSERKWPEKIEFDTSQPTIVPPAGEVSSVAAPPAPLPPEETTGKPVLEALAQLSPGHTAQRNSASSRTNQAQAREDRSIESRRQSPGCQLAGKIGRG